MLTSLTEYIASIHEWEDLIGQPRTPPEEISEDWKEWPTSIRERIFKSLCGRIMEVKDADEKRAS
jgi:hypothetical protein